MKIFLLTLCSFLILETTQAQHKGNKDSIAVANAVTELKNAMVDANVAVLEKLAAPNLSYGHSGGKIEDKAAFIKAFATNTSDFVKIDLTEQTIQITGKAAIVRHKLSATTNDGGKPGEVKLSVMLVWLKQNKQWQLIGRQAVKLP